MKKIVSKLKNGARLISIKLMKLVPIKKNKIVFSNFFGRGYGDNPKYITEEILRRNKEWDLVWLSNSSTNVFPKEIRVVKYGSLKAMYELSTAKIWVDNIRNSEHPVKRKGQYALQTWHGGLGFKNVEGQAQDKLSEEYIKHAKEDGANCDAIISSSGLQSDQFRKYFWLNPNAEVLEVGLPRNDVLFSDSKIMESKKNVKEYLGITDSCEVILYMPTFRDSGDISCYALDYDAIVNAFIRKFNKEFVLLIRLHPNASGLCQSIAFGKYAMDVTDYPDAQELYHVADYLITDYSSAAFDFILLDKPVFICALDMEEYSRERGFSDVINMVPFAMAQTNAELINNISTFSEGKYVKEVERFKNEWMPYDKGNASEKVYEWMDEIIEA